MKLEFRMQYLETICERYLKASKEFKGKILDELCKVCGYNRKYAIWKMGCLREGDKPLVRRVRHRIYDRQVFEVVEKVWEAASYPWSVRLREILRLWLPSMKKRFRITPEVENKLVRISASTLDRALREKKRRLRRRIYGRTKPGSLLKHQIPIRTEHWEVECPGYLELDLVSHSGECSSGEFIYSLNLTDIYSGWAETRAVMGKGEGGVLEALQAMSEGLPFKVLAIDSDNGSEFLNWHLIRHCEKEDIQFTRSRPYKKDDNAHIEQKNWTHVRKLIGWDRYDTLQALQAMNELYSHDLRLFMNLFQPSVKLQKIIRKGSRRTRMYDKPQTPLDRLLSSPSADQEKLLELKALRQQLNPFELSEKVNQKLERIWALACQRKSPSESGKTISDELNHLSSAERKTLKAISHIFGISVYVRTRKGGDLIRISHG